jgi:hypothetical protein
MDKLTGALSNYAHLCFSWVKERGENSFDFFFILSVFRFRAYVAQFLPFIILVLIVLCLIVVPILAV